MVRNRRLALGVLAATALLGAATTGLATVPGRPLRSVLTIVHTLSFRVAMDWLVVVALLAVGERYVSAGKTVDRRTVWRLAAAVFLGGFAIEASPFVRVFVEPSAVGPERLGLGLVAACQQALAHAGLFAATAAGAATLSDAFYGRAKRAATGGLPLAPAGRWRRRLLWAAATRTAFVLGAVGAVTFAMEAVARLAFGAPHAWLAVADAALAALTGAVSHAVLALAFLALVVAGVRVRTLVGGTALVWVALFAGGVLVAVLSGLVGVALVSATTTPMGAVEAAALGQWPAPDSWTLLLQVGTFLAGAVGLLAVQRTPPVEAAGLEDWLGRLRELR